MRDPEESPRGVTVSSGTKFQTAWRILEGLGEGLGETVGGLGSESCLSSFSLSISEPFDGRYTASSSVLEWLSRQRVGDRVIVTVVIY